VAGSGEEVGQIAQAQAAYNVEIDRLIADNPGLNNEEAIAAMEPVWEEVRQRFGEAVAHNPQFIRQVYESVGGEERWGTDPVEGQYEQALRRAPANRFGY
jgi:hypothetical protein